MPWLEPFSATMRGSEPVPVVFVRKIMFAGCWVWKKRPSSLKLYEQNRHDLIPGMVRVSLAAYNTREEVDHLLEWLHRIAKNRYEFKKKYRLAADSGSFIPVDYAAGQFVNNIYNRHLPEFIR